MIQFEDLLVSDIYFVICTNEGSTHTGLFSLFVIFDIDLQMILPLTLFVLHSRVPKIVMKCFEFCAPKQCLVHHHRHQKTIRSCLKIVKAFLDVHLLQTKYILLRIFVSILFKCLH